MDREDVLPVVFVVGVVLIFVLIVAEVVLGHLSMLID